jgi:hypothetical protein
MDGNITSSWSQGQFASPGILGTINPYQVPDGWGQGWPGNIFGQAAQPIGGTGFLGQLSRPIGLGLGGAFGNPQFGGYPGGGGGQLFGPPQAIQVIQLATQQAAEVAQQVAHQAAQQAAQPVAQQAAFIAQQVAQQAAQQLAQHVAQQVAMTAQHVAQQAAQQAAQQVAQQAAITAQQVAQQAAQQVAQQAALTAQMAAQQVAQQVVAGGICQQQGGNPFGQSAIPQGWGWQGGYGNYLGQQGFRGLNPFAGGPLGAQSQLAGFPRFSFA